MPAPNGSETDSVRIFSLRPSSQPLMALIDEDICYVAGYFDETRLARVREGMLATVHIMGEGRTLKGHVESFSAGIEDRERVTVSGTLLASVNHTFSWIRLALRIPVCIALDDVQEVQCRAHEHAFHRIVGRTAVMRDADVADEPKRFHLAQRRQMHLPVHQVVELHQVDAVGMQQMERLLNLPDAGLVTGRPDLGGEEGRIR